MSQFVDIAYLPTVHGFLYTTGILVDTDLKIVSQLYLNMYILLGKLTVLIQTYRDYSLYSLYN